MVPALEVNEEAGHPQQMVENPTATSTVDPTSIFGTQVEAANNGNGVTKNDQATVASGKIGAQAIYLEAVGGNDGSGVGQKVVEVQMTGKTKGGVDPKLLEKQREYQERNGLWYKEKKGSLAATINNKTSFN